MSALADAGSVGPRLTWLYVPGDRPDRVTKALASDADAVIVDLEDAVAVSCKERARSATAELLSTAPAKPVYVRVNGFGTPWSKPDVLAIGHKLGLAGIRLPKVTSTSELRVVDTWLEHTANDIALQCLIESALGVEASFEIASHPSVTDIGLGEADLRADIGVSTDNGLAWARSRIVIAARAASLPPPAQSVYTRIGDPEGLVRSCKVGRELGFFGRAAIHPEQLATIVQAYLPTGHELARAREVIDSAGDHACRHLGGGFALPDGRFVDAAVVAGARRTVGIADRHGTAR